MKTVDSQGFMRLRSKPVELVISARLQLLFEIVSVYELGKQAANIRKSSIN